MEEASLQSQTKATPIGIQAAAASFPYPVGVLMGFWQGWRYGDDQKT